MIHRSHCVIINPKNEQISCASLTGGKAKAGITKKTNLANQSGTGIKPISYSKENHRQNPRPIQVTFRSMDQ